MESKIAPRFWFFLSKDLQREKLKKEKEEKTTASGIILTSEKEKSKLAVVACIGADVKDAGYACGDKVLYKEYSGTTMQLDDEEFIVIKDEDIIAVSKQQEVMNYG